ncbi:unnamed protein product [Clonostachys chloroleuca]|uniref:Uncharacterized protein n=1 Tax=Clonostachys chloroleuca TaxID=1926264 RepID=A0AA35Q8T9_9HYPO|nr:unnamed protein product [Clonostachys chloroleuca]
MQQQDTDTDADKLRVAAEKLRFSRGHLKGRDLAKMKVVKKAFIESERERNPASRQTAKVHKKVESVLSTIYVKCGPLMFILCCVAFNAHTMIKCMPSGGINKVIDGLEEWKSTDEWKSLSADFGGEDLIRSVFDQNFVAALRKLDHTRLEKTGLRTPVRDRRPSQQVGTDCWQLQQPKEECQPMQQAREEYPPLHQPREECQPMQQAREEYQPLQQASAEYQPLQQASTQLFPILPANDPPTDHGTANEGFWAQSVSSSPPWTEPASDGGLSTPETHGPYGSALPAPIVYTSDLMEVMRIASTFNTFNHRLELSPDSYPRLKITMVVDCSPEQGWSLTQNKLPSSL